MRLTFCPGAARDMPEAILMGEKHPDAPGGGSVDEELTEETRDSMDMLGRAPLESESGPGADEGEGPGQDSDQLPQ